MKFNRFLTKSLALTLVLAFSFTNSVAYSDAPSVISAFKSLNTVTPKKLAASIVGRSELRELLGLPVRNADFARLPARQGMRNGSDQSAFDTSHSAIDKSRSELRVSDVSVFMLMAAFASGAFTVLVALAMAKSKASRLRNIENRLDKSLYDYGRSRRLPRFVVQKGAEFIKNKMQSEPSANEFAFDEFVTEFLVELDVLLHAEKRGPFFSRNFYGLEHYLSEILEQAWALKNQGYKLELQEESTGGWSVSTVYQKVLVVPAGQEAGSQTILSEDRSGLREGTKTRKIRSAGGAFRRSDLETMVLAIPFAMLLYLVNKILNSFIPDVSSTSKASVFIALGFVFAGSYELVKAAQRSEFRELLGLPNLALSDKRQTLSESKQPNAYHFPPQRKTDPPRILAESPSAGESRSELRQISEVADSLLKNWHIGLLGIGAVGSFVTYFVMLNRDVEPIVWRMKNEINMAGIRIPRRSLRQVVRPLTASLKDPQELEEWIQFTIEAVIKLYTDAHKQDPGVYHFLDWGHTNLRELVREAWLIKNMRQDYQFVFEHPTIEDSLTFRIPPRNYLAKVVPIDRSELRENAETGKIRSDDGGAFVDSNQRSLWQRISKSWIVQAVLQTLLFPPYLIKNPITRATKAPLPRQILTPNGIAVKKLLARADAAIMQSRLSINRWIKSRFDSVNKPFDFITAASLPQYLLFINYLLSLNNIYYSPILSFSPSTKARAELRSDRIAELQAELFQVERQLNNARANWLMTVQASDGPFRDPHQAHAVDMAGSEVRKLERRYKSIHEDLNERLRIRDREKPRRAEPRIGEAINSDRAPKAVGAYPHARRFQDHLFLSGVGPRKLGSDRIPGVHQDDKGKVLSRDIATQMRSTFANVEFILEAAGVTWKAITEMEVFLTDYNDDERAIFERVWAEHFKQVGHEPKHTIIEVVALPTPIAFEVNAIAKVPESLPAELVVLEAVGPENDNGEIRAEGIGAQVQAAIQNIRTQLEKEGSSWENILAVRVSLSDMARDFPEYNSIWKTTFPPESDQPARTTVSINTLPRNVLINVKVIAAKSRAELRQSEKAEDESAVKITELTLADEGRKREFTKKSLSQAIKSAVRNALRSTATQDTLLKPDRIDSKLEVTLSDIRDIRLTNGHPKLTVQNTGNLGALSFIVEGTFKKSKDAGGAAAALATGSLDLSRFEASRSELRSEVETGLAYWRGELATTPISRPFRASRKEDVFDITEIDPQEALRLEAIAVKSLDRGEGYISMLVAGASSRMNTKEAPEEVLAMDVDGEILSKAAVPIGRTSDGKVTTYFGEFGENLSRLFRAVAEEVRNAGMPVTKVWENLIGFLSNDEYRPEHDEMLGKNRHYGLHNEQVGFFHQPLGAKFVEKPEKVEKMRSKFTSDETFQAALARSNEVKEKLASGDTNAVVFEGERDPLGHGEYFHQMIVSGELLRMVDAGVKWAFVKNVDNYASKFDKVWLRTLGLFLDRELDFQPEVSPRAPGQKGGSLIIMEDNGAHQLAEDPNINITNDIVSSADEEVKKQVANRDVVKPTDSYWFNDAVAFFTPRYVIGLYKQDGQADREFIEELRGATPAEREAIAERGRRKFPRILDAKPAKSGNAVVVKAETNMWQSTGVAGPDMKIAAVGVKGVRNLPIEEYLKLSWEERIPHLAGMRFLSTKNWTKSPAEVDEARAAMEKALGRPVTDNELWVTLETYEGNKILAADLLRYNREAELVTPGIFSRSELRAETGRKPFWTRARKMSVLRIALGVVLLGSIPFYIVYKPYQHDVTALEGTQPRLLTPQEIEKRRPRRPAPEAIAPEMSPSFRHPTTSRKSIDTGKIRITSEWTPVFGDWKAIYKNYIVVFKNSAGKQFEVVPDAHGTPVFENEKRVGNVFSSAQTGNEVYFVSRSELHEPNWLAIAGLLVFSVGGIFGILLWPDIVSWLRRNHSTKDNSHLPDSRSELRKMDTEAIAAETAEAKILAEKLTTPLDAKGNAEMAARFLKGGYDQDGYGVPEGAAIHGSFAVKGTQGYYSEDVNPETGRTGQQEFVDGVNRLKKFFIKREERLGKPIKLIIKTGIGGQHTPFQGIADVFQVVDPASGDILGEYELGKDYEKALENIVDEKQISWDQIAVIPSSKSGSTDETMMIFSEIFYVLLKKVAQEKTNLEPDFMSDAKAHPDIQKFADTVFNTLHDINFVDGKERSARDLFKIDEVRFRKSSLIQIIAKKMNGVMGEAKVKEIFATVLGNMFFETTDRPAESRLSAFIRNSGLDKVLGDDAPGFGAMFDNVGGRWTGDLHMMTFLAYHRLNPLEYWIGRNSAIKRGGNSGEEIGNRILNDEISDVALIVPNHLFWFAKSVEQNFNESIWQKGFANLVAIRERDWQKQPQWRRFFKQPNRLVINLADIQMPPVGFNVFDIDELNLGQSSKIKKADKQFIADQIGKLFSIFYTATTVVGNRLIARALKEKGFSVNDVNLNDLDNPATKIVQENLYTRQPYVELGKKLLESWLQDLQMADAVEHEFALTQQKAKELSVNPVFGGQAFRASISLEEGISWQNTDRLSNLIKKAMDYADQSGRKFVPFIYLDGDKFVNLKKYLVDFGIEWVIQGTGDQHISYQQVLANPDKFLPFFVSFVPEQGKESKGLPAIGFAKGYLHNVSPHMVRDMFAEASFGALVNNRKDQGGEGVFLRLTDDIYHAQVLRSAFRKAAQARSELRNALDSNAMFIDFGGVLADERSPAFAELVAKGLIVKSGLRKEDLSGDDFNKLKNLLVPHKDDPIREALYTDPDAFYPWFESIREFLSQKDGFKGLSEDEFKDIFFGERPENPAIKQVIEKLLAIKDNGVHIGVVVNFELAGKEHLLRFLKKHYGNLFDPRLVILSSELGMKKGKAPEFFDKVLERFRSVIGEDARNTVLIDNDPDAFEGARQAGFEYLVHYAKDAGKAPFTGDQILQAADLDSGAAVLEILARSELRASKLTWTAFWQTIGSWSSVRTALRRFEDLERKSIKQAIDMLVNTLVYKKVDVSNLLKWGLPKAINQYSLDQLRSILQLINRLANSRNSKEIEIVIRKIDSIYDVLIQNLSSHDPETRRLAVIALGHLEDDRALPHLEKLKDDFRRVETLITVETGEFENVEVWPEQDGYEAKHGLAPYGGSHMESRPITEQRPEFVTLFDNRPVVKGAINKLKRNITIKLIQQKLKEQHLITATQQAVRDTYINLANEPHFIDMAVKILETHEDFDLIVEPGAGHEESHVVDTIEGLQGTYEWKEDVYAPVWVWDSLPQLSLMPKKERRSELREEKALRDDIAKKLTDSKIRITPEVVKEIGEIWDAISELHAVNQGRLYFLNQLAKGVRPEKWDEAMIEALEEFQSLHGVVFIQAVRSVPQVEVEEARKADHDAKGNKKEEVKKPAPKPVLTDVEFAASPALKPVKASLTKFVISVSVKAPSADSVTLESPFKPDASEPAAGTTVIQPNQPKLGEGSAKVYFVINLNIRGNVRQFKLEVGGRNTLKQVLAAVVKQAFGAGEFDKIAPEISESQIKIFITSKFRHIGKTPISVSNLSVDWKDAQDKELLNILTGIYTAQSHSMPQLQVLGDLVENDAVQIFVTDTVRSSELPSARKTLNSDKSDIKAKEAALKTLVDNVAKPFAAAFHEVAATPYPAERFYAEFSAAIEAMSDLDAALKVQSGKLWLFGFRYWEEKLQEIVKLAAKTKIESKNLKELSELSTQLHARSREIQEKWQSLQSQFQGSAASQAEGKLAEMISAGTAAQVSELNEKISSAFSALRNEIAARSELRRLSEMDATKLISKYIRMKATEADETLVKLMARDYDYRSRDKEHAPSPKLWFLWGLTWARMAFEKAKKSGSKNETVVIARDARKIEPELVEALTAGFLYAGLDVVYTAEDGPNAATSYSWAVREIQPLVSVLLTSSHVASTDEIRGAKVSIQDEEGRLASLTTQEIKAVSLPMVQKYMADYGWMVHDAGERSGYIRALNVDVNTVRITTLVGRVAGIGGSAANLFNLADQLRKSDFPEKVLSDWEQRIAGYVMFQKPFEGLRIAIDGAHTPSGYLAEAVFKNLGAEAVLINGDVQSITGMHKADPSIMANLEELRTKMSDENIDIGLAFDLDGDRGAIVIKRKDGSFLVLPPDNLMAILIPFLVNRGGYHSRSSEHVAVISDVLSTLGVADAAGENGIETFITDSGYPFLKAKAKELKGKGYSIPMLSERSGHAWLDVTGEYENPIAVAVLSVIQVAQYAQEHKTQNPFPFEAAFEHYAKPYKQSTRFQPPFQASLLQKLAGDPRNDTGYQYSDTATPNPKIIALGRDLTVEKAIQEFSKEKEFLSPAGIFKVREVITFKGEDGLYRFADIRFKDEAGKEAGRFVIRASSNDPTFVASYEVRVRTEGGETLESESVKNRYISTGGIVFDWLEREQLAHISGDTVKDGNTRTESASLAAYRQFLESRSELRASTETVHPKVAAAEAAFNAAQAALTEAEASKQKGAILNARVALAEKELDLRRAELQHLTPIAEEPDGTQLLNPSKWASASAAVNSAKEGLERVITERNKYTNPPERSNPWKVRSELRNSRTASADFQRLNAEDALNITDTRLSSLTKAHQAIGTQLQQNPGLRSELHRSMAADKLIHDSTSQGWVFARSIVFDEGLAPYYVQIAAQSNVRIGFVTPTRSELRFVDELNASLPIDRQILYAATPEKLAKLMRSKGIRTNIYFTDSSHEAEIVRSELSDYFTSVVLFTADMISSIRGRLGKAVEAIDQFIRSYQIVLSRA